MGSVGAVVDCAGGAVGGTVSDSVGAVVDSAGGAVADSATGFSARSSFLSAKLGFGTSATFLKTATKNPPVFCVCGKNLELLGGREQNY